MANHNTDKNNKNEKKRTRKVNPARRHYDLDCGYGYVVEVSKGCFIGQDAEDGGTCLVDDLTYGYPCPIGEAGDLAIEYLGNANIPRQDGYPKLHFIRKMVRVYPSQCLEDFGV